MDYQKAVSYLEPYTAALQKIPSDIQAEITDIRVHVNRPIMLCRRKGVLYLNWNGTFNTVPSAASTCVSASELDSIFQRMCGYAVYSHMEEIQNGYIAAGHGLRVGLSGTVIAEHGVVRSMRGITGLCIRIPRQILGCSTQILRTIPNLPGGLLIAGPPSSGKTTLLRDVARNLGNAGHRVVVLDERFELLSDGFDLGIGTEVLQGCPKAAGFSHAIRCLAPEYILCDELGDNDLPAVQASVFAGVILAATVHAGRTEELLSRPLCRSLLETGAFSHIASLQAGKIRLIKVRDLFENIGSRYADSVGSERWPSAIHAAAKPGTGTGNIPERNHFHEEYGRLYRRGSSSIADTLSG